MFKSRKESRSVDFNLETVISENKPKEKKSSLSWNSIFKSITNPFDKQSLIRRNSMEISNELEKQFLKMNSNSERLDLRKHENSNQPNIIFNGNSSYYVSSDRNEKLPTLYEISKNVVRKLCSGDPISQKKMKLAKAFMLRKPTLMKEKSLATNEFIQRVCHYFLPSPQLQKSPEKSELKLTSQNTNSHQSRKNPLKFQFQNTLELNNSFTRENGISNSFTETSHEEIESSDEESMSKSRIEQNKKKMEFFNSRFKAIIPKPKSNRNHIGLFGQKLKMKRSISAECSRLLFPKPKCNLRVSCKEKSFLPSPNKRRNSEIGERILNALTKSKIRIAQTPKVEKENFDYSSVVFERERELESEIEAFSSRMNLLLDERTRSQRVITIRRKSCCCNCCGQSKGKSIKFQNIGVTRVNERRAVKMPSIVISPEIRKSQKETKIKLSQNTPKINNSSDSMKNSMLE